MKRANSRHVKRLTSAVGVTLRKTPKNDVSTATIQSNCASSCLTASALLRFWQMALFRSRQTWKACEVPGKENSGGCQRYNSIPKQIKQLIPKFANIISIRNGNAGLQTTYQILNAEYKFNFPSLTSSSVFHQNVHNQFQSYARGQTIFSGRYTQAMKRSVTWLLVAGCGKSRLDISPEFTNVASELHSSHF